MKCTFCANEAGIEQASTRFCLTKAEDGTFHIKKEHPYFYQCQLQMFVTDTKYCDFVVWTPNDEIHIKRLLPKDDFLSNTLPKYRI